MKLFPAIDLYEGAAVRLLRGDYQQMTVYHPNPLEQAQKFRDAGAEYLHMVDLEGAKTGGTPNFEVVKSIVEKSGLKVEIGGGVRSMEVVEQYISCGVMRVILGTAALTDPTFLEEAVSRFGDKIAVGVDIQNGMVAIKGLSLIHICQNHRHQQSKSERLFRGHLQCRAPQGQNSAKRACRGRIRHHFP